MRGASHLQILLLLVLGASRALWAIFLPEAQTLWHCPWSLRIPLPAPPCRNQDAGVCSLWAAPHVQPDRWGPGCSGWRVAVANKHSAPWSPCVRRVTHCTPVGVDGRSLFP
uniref:Serine protease 33 n=1 Tax=Mus musculus TaxID=10090 RepID=Z4YLD7_MOUSE